MAAEIISWVCIYKLVSPACTETPCLLASLCSSISCWDSAALPQLCTTHPKSAVLFKWAWVPQVKGSTQWRFNYQWNRGLLQMQPEQRASMSMYLCIYSQIQQTMIIMLKYWDYYLGTAFILTVYFNLIYGWHSQPKRATASQKRSWCLTWHTTNY